MLCPPGNLLGEEGTYRQGKLDESLSSLSNSTRTRVLKYTFNLSLRILFVGYICEAQSIISYIQHL